MKRSTVAFSSWRRMIASSSTNGLPDGMILPHSRSTRSSLRRKPQRKFHRAYHRSFLLKLIPDQHAFSLFEQQRADYEREGGDHYRIIQPGVNVSCLCHDRQPDEREQSAEYAVAYVIRQRQRRVSD